MKSKVLKIINNYGVISQLKYIQTEMFEFIEAIMILEHYEEFANDQDYQTTLKQQKAHIEEEYADLMVMLEQFHAYYDLDDMHISEEKKKKIDRQLDRIEKEK